MMMFTRITTGLLPAALLAMLAMPGAATAQAPGKALDEQAVRDIIVKTLKDRPEIVLEALRTLEARAQAAKSKALLTSRSAEIFRHKDDPVGGNPDGDVTLVEFFDYQCGFCKRVHPTIRKLLKDDHNIRYVYKELPILGPASVYATRAALAAKTMGQYHKISEALMSARGALSEARILSIVADAGIDGDTLKAEIARGEEDAKAFVRRNYELAEALGINGTPAFVVGDQLIRGAADLKTLRTAITKARAEKKW